MARREVVTGLNRQAAAFARAADLTVIIAGRLEELTEQIAAAQTEGEILAKELTDYRPPAQSEAVGLFRSRPRQTEPTARRPSPDLAGVLAEVVPEILTYEKRIVAVARGRLTIYVPGPEEDPEAASPGWLLLGIALAAISGLVTGLLITLAIEGPRVWPWF